MTLQPFFQSSPHRKIFLFLGGVFLLTVTVATVSFLLHPAPVFTWQQLQELQPQEVPLYAFERGNLTFTIGGENYILFERWLGNMVKPNLMALDIYLIVLGVALSTLFAVISALRRFWFYIGATAAVFFVALLRWESLLLFNSDSRALSLIAVGSVMALLLVFQFYNKGSSFATRLTSFLLLCGALAVGVNYFAAAPHPLRLLAVNSLNPAICLALIFIILIAHQVLASFVTLAASSSRTNSLRQFLFISVIYLLNLWLAYLDRIGWLSWDYTVPSFVLFGASAVLTIWTVRQRGPIYESIFPSEPLLVYFVLSLGTLSFGVYGYFFSTANDIALLSFNDLILYVHLGYGMMFIVYVASNFLGVFEKNLAVDKILYKPTNMPYFTYRLAGLIATLAFIFYNTWFTHVSHFTSAFYTALGDVYLDQPSGKAHTFYKRAHFYAPYNQYASTLLAEWEGFNQNYGKQREYSRNANSFHPTEFTLLNTDQLYITSGNAFAEIQLLRQAKDIFPRSGLIRNNLGIAFARVHFPDSAAHYFREARKDSRTANSAEMNLLGILAKSDQRQNADSVFKANATGPVSVQANAIAIANHEGTPVNVPPELPQDSVLDLFTAARMANILTNQTNRADTAFINAAVVLVRKPGNLAFRHLILPAAAKALYATGMVNRAVELLTEAVFLGENPDGDNYTLGLMAMDQEKFDVAINYFQYALQHNSPSASLANAVALAEEGRTSEAIVAWDTISKRRDSSMFELAESMKRALAAPSSWYSSLTETEQLYYALYRIPLSDSLLFNQLVKQISNEDLRAKAYLNRAREYYRIDETAKAARQYDYLLGLHLTDTELFAEIKYFEMRLLATQGRIEELWKLIDQGITFGAYHQSEKFYYEGLKAWAQGDTATARQQLTWLADNNWYFDEGVVSAAAFHRTNPRIAYSLVSNALQVNPRSVRILKAYIPIALDRGFDQYAADALVTLRGLVPPASFRQYVDAHQFSGLLPP